MYAVVKTSGRQFKVSPGTSFSVEKLEGAPGSTLELTDVLFIGGDQTLIGSPLISGAKVKVVIEQQYRGPKVLVFKKKRRHKYRKMRGHRSELTRLFVAEIQTPHGTVKAEGKPHVIETKEVSAPVKKSREERLAERKAKASAEPVAKKAKATAAPKKSGAKKSTAGKKKAGAKKAASKAKKKS